MTSAADPDLLAPRTQSGWTHLKKIRRLAPFALAAMGVAGIGLYFFRPAPTAIKEPKSEIMSLALAAPCEQRTLEDGSVIELNRGAEVRVNFTPGERRVELVKGEGNFIVAKNPTRPFIVTAAGVRVHAVGTAFNVRLNQAAVEILVTEGKVKVDRFAANKDSTQPKSEVPLLAAGQSTVVSLASVPPPSEIATLSAEEMAAKLAWQPRLLDFTDAPLVEIVAEFNRRNPVQLVLGDESLGAMRLSATFRSDNIEGFLRLMQSSFGVRVEWRSERGDCVEPLALS